MSDDAGGPATPGGRPSAPGTPGGVRLRLARLASGLSQEQLAAAAAVSRQAVAGIEAGRFDPSLRVALDLARALGRSVEDLFAPPLVRPPEPALLVGALPGEVAGLRADPAEVAGRRVALALAGDQALRPGFLPAQGTVAGPAPPVASAGPTGRSHAGADVPGATPGPTALPVLVESGPPGQRAVVVAGCDPALGLLAGPLARLEPPRRLAWWPCNSAAALELAAAGLVHAAGVHLPEDGPGIGGGWAEASPGGGAEVIGFGAWQEGLALAPGLPAGPLDLAAVAERGLRIVNREEGSEARQLLDAELARAGLDGRDLAGYASEVRAHLLVASAVAAGLGAAGVTMEPAALAYGLRFVPLAWEAFRLVVPRPTIEAPETQALLEVLSAPGLRLELERLPGYDASSCGEAAGSL